MGEVGLYSALSGRWEYIPLVASVQAVPKKSVVLPQETSYKPKNYVTIRNISQDFTSSSTDSTPRPISAQDLKKLSSDENIALWTSVSRWNSKLLLLMGLLIFL